MPDVNEFFKKMESFFHKLPCPCLRSRKIYGCIRPGTSPAYLHGYPLRPCYGSYRSSR